MPSSPNNKDLERQDSSLPRLQRDPFDLSNENEDIETLNNSRYSQASKFQDYEEDTDSSSSNKAAKLIPMSRFSSDKPYGGPNDYSASNAGLNDDDTLNEEDYMQPLTGASRSRGSKTRFGSRGNLKFEYPKEYRRQRKSPRRILIAMVVIVPVAIVVMLFLLLKWTSPTESKNSTPATAPTGLTYPSGFNMKNNWGSLSPYFDTGATFPGIDPAVNEGLHELPKQCRMKQVHVLHRHAERYPTTGSGHSMEETARKLKSMTEPPAKALEFLNGWNYTLDVELLVSKGYATEYTSGANFWASHGVHLFNATQHGRFLYDPALNVYPNGTARPPVVIRATSQSRIRNSAKAWAAGFFGLVGEDPMRSKESAELLKDPENIYNLVLQTEANQQNSTLAAYYACPNGNKSKYSNGGRRAKEWVDIYLQDAVTRLAKLLPGLDAVKDSSEEDSTDSLSINNKYETGKRETVKSTTLTTTDVYNMQHLCSYETALYGSSAFCSLFTEKEWRGYEYAGDLVFYGMASYGTPVGAPEGAGWLYELLARLEGRQLYEHDAGWGINTTLTSTPDVFPLDQVMYLDMSHDSILVSVLTALGLDFLKEELPSTKILAPRQFVLSRLTPFGARIFVEILNCGDVESDEAIIIPELAENGEKSKRKASETSFVRMKLNNRVLPLGSLKKCPVDKEGLCPLGDFIGSLKYALSQVDFDRNCFGIPEGYEDAEDDDEEDEARRFVFGRM